MPCIRRQFLLEYCSCLSDALFHHFCFPEKRTSLLQTFNLLIFLVSLFLILIGLFCNIISCTCQIFQLLFTLIWLSLVDFATSYIFTTFASNSFKSLNKIPLQLELLSPSAKRYPASALELPEHS